MKNQRCVSEVPPAGNKVVTIGGIEVSGESSAVLKTYALGTCVAVTVYHRPTGIGGMVHVALSDSGINRTKAAEMPGYFADTGIAGLLELMKKKVPGIDLKKCEVKIAGGAKVVDNGNFFDIGGKNIAAVKRILNTNGMRIHAEDLGGKISRTVELNIENGKVMIINVKAGKWEI